MSKYGGLKKKWHKALKAELKALNLPEPGSIYGFYDEQLQECPYRKRQTTQASHQFGL